MSFTHTHLDTFTKITLIVRLLLAEVKDKRLYVQYFRGKNYGVINISLIFFTQIRLKG